MTDERRGSGLWTALAALGGALSGIAAILALFITTPNTINVLIPEAALERAGFTPAGQAAQQAPQQAPLAVEAPSVQATETSAPAPAAPLPEPPSLELAPGFRVSLIGVADTPDRFVATFRFSNATEAPIGVAVQRAGAFEADMVLTDGRGGSCQMISNGEGWGSLESTELNPHFVGSTSPFRLVPSGGAAQHAVFFNKGRCATQIRIDSAVFSIAGALILENNRMRRAAPLAFDGVAPTY